MKPTTWISYNYAIIRVVPRVHLGAFFNAGVILHARSAEFLDMRILIDPVKLAQHSPLLDPRLLTRYLRSYCAICRGDPAGGPVAGLSPSERFHWLTAPRSDVLQPSPVHEGLCRDPRAELEVLFAQIIEASP